MWQLDKRGNGVWWTHRLVVCCRSCERFRVWFRLEFCSRLPNLLSENWFITRAADDSCKLWRKSTQHQLVMFDASHFARWRWFGHHCLASVPDSVVNDGNSHGNWLSLKRRFATRHTMSRCPQSCGPNFRFRMLRIFKLAKKFPSMKAGFPT